MWAEIFTATCHSWLLSSPSGLKHLVCLFEINRGNLKIVMCSDHWGEEQESLSSNDQITVFADVTNDHFW